MLQWLLNLFIDRGLNSTNTRHIATIYDSVRINGEYKPAAYFSFILLEHCGVRTFKYIGRKRNASKYGLFKYSKIYITIVIPWLYGDYTPLINFAKKHDIPIPIDYTDFIPRYDTTLKMTVVRQATTTTTQLDPTIKALDGPDEY